MNYRRNFYILLGIAFLACLTLGYIAYNQTRKVNNQSTQISALTDTVTSYKTKSGLNGAVKTVFIGTKRLNTIKNTKGIQSYTKLKTVTKIDTVVKLDTIFLLTDSSKLSFNQKINNPYYQADIIVKDDSLMLALKVVNDFEIVTREKNNGFLKAKTLVVDVVNKNPYTVNAGLTSFEIKPKKRTGLKISLGLAFARYLLLK